jgi:hypothetical protein
VPPPRNQVDGNVAAFQALSSTEAFVLATNGNLWHETGPWGTVPPTRQQVDGNVAAFQALSPTEAFVLGTNGNGCFALPASARSGGPLLHRIT